LSPPLRLPRSPTLLLILILLALTTPALADPPVVHFLIDPTADVKPISPYIYGINEPITPDFSGATLTRLGGNRWSAYNWTNNASNAGNDYHFQNDGYLRGDDVPGGAMIPGIQNAKGHHAAIILTVPMAGYVSADKTPGGDVRNSGPDYLTSRFRPIAAEKHGPFTLTPDPNSPVVFEDEFVNWAKTQSDSPIWFMLDNEPDIWAETHAEIHPDPPTYAEMARKTIEFSTAIKNVDPNTLIFGPANYGWNGYVTFQNAPDRNGRDFQEFYLSQMAAAEHEVGHRLLDVLDVHWYPEVRAGGVRITDPSTLPSVATARIQAPRSLWDPDYLESSWIANNLREPIRLIPRLMDKIARNYPGTKLSISEYNYGGGNDISGALAEADVLGIFGREGVFAACEWPLHRREPFIAAAFRMFRDFDGQGATFGDTSVHAQTDDVADTSVYGATDSQTHQMTAVAINKTDHDIAADFQIDHESAASVELFQLTSSNAAPVGIGKVDVNNGELAITLPPLSVTTIRFAAQ